MSEKMNKLQAVLDAQIGRGNVHNVVAAVQSQDRHIDFLGAVGMAEAHRYVEKGHKKENVVITVTHGNIT